MVLKLAGLEKPQLNMMSVIVLLEWVSNFSAYCRRVLRMKACGVRVGQLLHSAVQMHTAQSYFVGNHIHTQVLIIHIIIDYLHHLFHQLVFWRQVFFYRELPVARLSLPINLFFKVRRTLSRLMMVRRRMSILNGFTT